MKVKCPRCAKQTEFEPSNPFRPFCSERCKLIDFGAWATESYAIPAKPATEAGDDEESEAAIEAESHVLDDEEEDSLRSKH